jgi:hypothetical protein
MKFYVTRKILVGIILALCALIYFMFLTGCARGAVQPGAAASIPTGPAQVLSRIAIAATAVAGASLIACGFLAVFYANKYLVAKLAIACVAIIIASQIVYQFGQHLGIVSLIAALAAVAGAGLWAWAHLSKIEKRLMCDLNRDGKIG